MNGLNMYMENVDKNDQKLYIYDYYRNWIIQYFPRMLFYKLVFSIKYK